MQSGMNNYNRISINHKIYHSGNLDYLLSDVHDEGDKDWVFAIADFLKDWFSDDPFIEGQTSGSTGPPKKIQLSKAAMVNSANATCTYFNLTAKDNAMLCLPVSYIAGKMMLVRALVCGFNLILVKPASNPFWNINTPVDFAAVTPHQLFESIETIKNNDIKKIIAGGAPISGILENKLQTLSCSVYETYGMTETCSHIALRKLNGSGRSELFTLLQGISIEIDYRGCLVIKAPALSAEKLITNDVVEIVDSSHFRWFGRFDHVINSGGIKLFPEQIERKLESILEDYSYYVSGIKDEKLGEKLILLIEGRPFAMEDITKLKKQLRETLQTFEVPRDIVFVERFERSESGKILKNRTKNLEPRTKMKR
jgi:O-succinylbenzoic acid--CoA ligase